MLKRDEAAKMLNVSVATIVRLEKKGKLTPIKYQEARNSLVFYKESQVKSLMQ